MSTASVLPASVLPASVLISGASGHLGASVLARLVAEGYSVLAPASSAASAAALTRERVTAAQVNLTDESSVREYVAAIANTRELRAAVLLAGGFAMGGLRETDGAALRKMIATNFETAFHLVRELLPVFERRGGGQFVLIGSRPAISPADGQHVAAYALSKGMVMQLAELVNAAGRDKNIDATVIVPSTIDTAANREAMPNADPKRWVSPQAIADTIAFVLSDTGRQMRGSVLKLYNES
jgi:NAD(P)-dependent dehydrogenase (short-subunit alcohol dehydrogenase family)